MALKDKAWLIALAGGVLALIGWCTPYLWVSGMGMDVMYWSWGLASVMGMILFDSTFAVAGILIIIGAILAIATGYLSKTREELKIMAIIWVVAGILALIGVFIPLGYGATVGLSIGFYLPLFGGIIAILAGVVVLFVK
jgi:hypothetical protein